MPGTINAHYVVENNAAHFFSVGPIPPSVLMRSVTLELCPSIAQTVTIGMVIARTDDPNAAGFRAASSLYYRSNTVLLGHPAIAYVLLASTINIISLPIERRLPSGFCYVMVRAQANQMEHSLGIVAIVNWIDRDEESALFGDRRRVTVVTAAAPAGIPPLLPGYPPGVVPGAPPVI